MPVTGTERILPELQVMWVLSCTLGVVLLVLGSGGRAVAPVPCSTSSPTSGCWCTSIHEEAVLGYPAKDELLRPLARGVGLPVPPP